MLWSCRRASVVVGALVLGLSLFAGGCGKPTSNARNILIDFQNDNAAAVKKYQGKTVRLSVEKVTTSGKVLDFVTVQGQVGNVLIDATVTDPAEQQKALTLKVGSPAIFEGEPANGMGQVKGMGALFLKSAKISQ